MSTTFSKIFSSLKSNPSQLFLIDGLGAIATAISHGVVLVSVQHLIGIPENLLYILALVASTFATYSLLCYFIRPKSPAIFIRIIAIANLLFCVATLSMMIYYYEVVLPLGYAYFMIEIAIVTVIITMEFGLAKTLSD